MYKILFFCLKKLKKNLTVIIASYKLLKYNNGAWGKNFRTFPLFLFLLVRSPHPHANVHTHTHMLAVNVTTEH